MQKVIESTDISKAFGSTKALNDITFSVNESEIFGFIGPDGAGKTTLFRIIATLLLPDKGEMKVLGMDCIAGFKELRKILDICREGLAFTRISLSKKI